MNLKVRIQKFFRMDARGTTIVLETKAGISAAFISIFVLLASIQIILKASGASENKVLIPLLSIALLYSSLLSIFGGIYTRLPLLFLSTIGMNVFLATNVISALSFDWGIGLGILLVESLLFTILAFTKVPTLFMEQLPTYFKKAAPITIGGILLFYSLLAAKVIAFNGTTEITSITFRSSAAILFFIGIAGTYFLYKEKASMPFLQGSLLTLLLGMYIPSIGSGLSFYKPLFIVIAFFLGWMLLYSILVDKHNKKSLEVSLWVIMIIMAVCLFWYSHTDPLIPKPLNMIGKLGLFGLPKLGEAYKIIGYPIFNLGNVFKNFGKLIIPIFSLLVVHWISYFSFVEILKGYISFKKADQEKYFSQTSLMAEASAGIIGSSSGTGFYSTIFGSIFSLLSGAKTGFSSLVSSLVFLLFLFMIPLFSKSFLPIAIAPIFFIFGMKLIIDFFPLSMDDKINWIPIVITLLAGTLTMSLYNGIFAGLVSYVFIKIAYSKIKEISALTWFLVLTMVIWSFYRIPILWITLPKF